MTVIDAVDDERVIAPALSRRWVMRFILLLASIALLVFVACASLMIGSRPLPLDTVWSAIVSPDGSPEHRVVTDLRIPRTILGILVGAALGVGGALIQAFTRNPLADPGILGVNAGASFAIVVGVSFWGITSISQYLPLAFLGAVATTLLVYVIAGRGGGGATPIRLTLVGVALAAVLTGISSTLALLNPDTFDRMRYWGAGTIADRPDGTIAAVLPFIVVGLVIALSLARSLNAFALGDDLARSLGARLAGTRILTIASITLLCGAATAAAGPIAFIGLMIPHAVRWLTGPDQRWVLPFSLVLAPALLVASDILGRLVVAPAELQVGIVAAFIGAPVLIVLVRRTRGSVL